MRFFTVRTHLGSISQKYIAVYGLEAYHKQLRGID